MNGGFSRDLRSNVVHHLHLISVQKSFFMQSKTKPERKAAVKPTHHAGSLMLIIAQKAERAKEAEMAHRLLYFKYLTYVNDICEQLNRKYMIGEAGVREEVAGNVLFLMYDKAEKFHADTLKSAKQADAQLRSWLKGIAENEFLMYLRARKKKDTYYVPEKDLELESMLNLPTLSPENKNYLRELTEDRQITLVSLSKRGISSHTGKLVWMRDDLPDLLDDEPTEEEKEAELKAYLKKYDGELKEIKKVLAKENPVYKDVYLSYVEYQDDKGRLTEGRLDYLMEKHGLTSKNHVAKMKQRVRRRIIEAISKKFGTLEDEG